MLRLADGMSRLGTETAFEVLARAQALAAQGRDIINLGIGQPDFKTPDHIVEAAVKALRDGHHGYTPAPGIPPLREAVASYVHRQFGSTVSADRVVIVPGGKVTMFFAILMFGEPGAEILYPAPGFPIYESMIRFTGATPVPYPLLDADGLAPSPDQILPRLGASTRLLILNSPSNPTGGVASKDAIDALVTGLDDHPGVAVMSDEIYSRLVFDGDHTTLLNYPSLADRLILLDGWSKTYAMTGWRMGYGIWPDALVEHASRLAVNSNSCVNAATQFAGIAALEGPQDAVETMRCAFKERRDRVVPLLNTLPGMHCVSPGGAFYAYPDITKTGFDARTLQQRLLEEAGIATVAGPSFYSHDNDHIRISFAASMDALEQSIQRIGEWLSEHGIENQ